MRSKTTAFLSLAFLAFGAAAGAADKPLDIYWIDVEGGAATLIVTPAGESVLIDAGNPGGRDAARIQKVASEVAGLKRIDHLLVTHFHRDHFGGVAELAKLIPIGVLHERELATAPEGERGQPELAEYKAAAVERRTTVKPGLLTLRQAPGAAPLSLEVLGANAEFQAKPSSATNGCRAVVAKPADPSDNRNSVVTRLSFGAFRFFDGGDLTWNAEADLVCPQDRAGPVDVFQIDHHGLDVSNNPLLLRATAPTVVVVNNGPRKGNEPGSFAAVQATPSVQALYQMHRNLRSPQSNTLAERIANEPEDCAGGFLKLSVQPDGRRYSVEVPSTGHRQSYATRGAADVARASGRVEVLPREAERRVDVSIDGTPFTAYLWPESQAKHVLWPIRTSKGNEVTRGYPLAPKVGDKVDHPHHVGLWLNYGDVNGIDFWGNPGSISTAQNPARLGRIVHRKIVEAKGGDQGKLAIAADWLMPDGSVVLEETTAFAFAPLPDGRQIERTTTLRAKGTVVFKDTKEGMFGLRVVRSLEQPAGPKEKGAVIGKDYRPTPSAPLDNTGVSGLYRSSEGKTGDDVWGTRARWMTLSGKAGDEDVVIAILDHPKNPGAPTYWHARGYGLFAVNPLGQKDFSSGREELNFTLKDGQSAVFRYAVAILSGAYKEARVEELSKSFSQK